MALFLLAVLYCTPTFIALARSHRSRWGIIAANLLLGWTVIGWIICLVWSLSNTHNYENTIIVNNTIGSSNEQF
jgi:hypothetical protein